MNIHEQFSSIIDSIDDCQPVKVWTHYALAYSEANNIPYDPQAMGSCLAAYADLVVALTGNEQAFIIFRLILLDAQQAPPPGALWEWIRSELLFETLAATTKNRDEALHMILDAVDKVTDEILDSHNRRKNRLSGDVPAKAVGSNLSLND